MTRIQTPQPTRELVRLLKLVGSYTPELEDSIIPVVQVPLDDSFMVGYSPNVAPAGAATAAYDSETREAMLAQTVFANGLNDRGWTQDQVDVWLLELGFAATAATAANVSNMAAGINVSGAETILANITAANSNVGDLTNGGIQHFSPTRATDTTDMGYMFTGFPLLLPPLASMVRRGVSNGGGGCTCTFPMLFRIALRGQLRFP